jgi:hypothetical protein
LRRLPTDLEPGEIAVLILRAATPDRTTVATVPPAAAIAQRRIERGLLASGQLVEDVVRVRVLRELIDGRRFQISVAAVWLRWPGRS